MSEITTTKENIKILKRLLKSEKYILRQQLAHKKNNMSESHKKKKVKKKTKTSHKGSILAFKDCKCKYCKQPKAFGLSMTKALNAVMDEENKN